MPFRSPTSALFPQFFRGWNRVEGRSRHDNFAAGLKASTADPLWFLARMWQFKELRGEHAATAIHARASYETVATDRVKLGTQPFQALGDVPLEVLVEREKVEWDWHLRIRAGQHFERLAGAGASSLIGRLRASCPVALPIEGRDDWIKMDLATRRLVSLMAGRVINGEKLFALIDAGDASVPTSLASAMQTWYRSLYSQAGGRTSSAWKPEELDYEFRIQSSDMTLPGPLHARSYRTGSIDWDTFAVEGTSTNSFPAAKPRHLTPTHATYAGQPMRRWWEFEDASVHFGALEIAKTDLGKMILVQYGLQFGDDYFVVPLMVSPNSLVRVTELAVTDCFQEVTIIKPARDTADSALQRWEVFALSPDSPGGPNFGFLYAPPATGVREESPVLEQVVFARDEDANTVFGIETTVMNQIGDPVGGHAAHLEFMRRWRAVQAPAISSATDATTSTTGSTDEVLERPKKQFLLGTTVPPNWVPFVATDARNLIAGVVQRSVRLRRADLVSPIPEDAQRIMPALSRLFEAPGGGAVDWIKEEAVGRAGARVELRRQRMRSATGETYVWFGRKIGAGKGEARSGLRFDVVRDASSDGGTTT